MTLFADFNPNVSVPFSRVRQLFEDSALQAGVVGATDLKVAQRGAGANMSVDVPAGQAWVEVTTGTRNGLAHIVNDATANVVVSASNATNPRIDQIVLQYNDSSIPTGSGDVPTLAVLTGTPTAGAQITNTAGANYRAGATALGNDRLRLADILVPATSTSVTTANIVDRRPWARGARATFVATSNAGATNDIAWVNATFAQFDSGAGRTQLRLECSGVPVIWRVAGVASVGAAAVMNMKPLMDAGNVDSMTDTGLGVLRVASSGAQDWPFDFSYPIQTLTAGSHLFQVAAAGTFSIYARAASFRWIFEVREDVRPVVNNGTA